MRLRDEEQSFNLIDVKPHDVTITIQGWDGTGYAPADAQRYTRTDGHWARSEGATKGASAETKEVA